jgi:hypothetical protein
MIAEAEEVLATWRSAEQLLAALPADAPERNALAASIAQLRTIHARLRADRAAGSSDVVHESRERIVATRRLIAAADARLRIVGRRAPSR